jgi:predicted house-cleaning NTP pyrophosphatase (Maf/HAM1 superfamily)
MRPVIWITAAAAIIILAIIIVKPTTSYVQPDFTQLAFNDISSTEAENYINANLNDFEIDLIEELIISDNAIQENSDTTKTQPNEVKQTVTFDNISKEDILNYFENENIDIEDLEEESFI